MINPLTIMLINPLTSRWSTHWLICWQYVDNWGCAPTVITHWLTSFWHCSFLSTHSTTHLSLSDFIGFFLGIPTTCGKTKKQTRLLDDLHIIHHGYYPPRTSRTHPLSSSTTRRFCYSHRPGHVGPSVDGWWQLATRRMGLELNGMGCLDVHPMW